jgi:aspartate aminotransferase
VTLTAPAGGSARRLATHPPEAMADDLYRVSERVAAMKPSATAAVTDKAIELRQQGKDIISLSVGEPDFAPPEAVVNATAAAATDGHTRYTAVAGTHELRQEIARYLTEKKDLPYSAEQILVSSGGKQSLVQVIVGLCGPGDEVLVPAPHWVRRPADPSPPPHPAPPQLHAASAV